MEYDFEKLMKLSDDYRARAKKERFFLQTTASLLVERDQTYVLEIVAEFDRFKKEAMERDEEFYAKFFHFLATVLKRKYLDHSDDDFAATTLDDFQ